MSVPVNKRSHGELEVNVMARELCAYTLRITANPKKFPVEQKSFTEKIRDAAIDIYTLCWEANNIKVDNRMDRYLRRIELQEIAADKCNTLCALIGFYAEWMNITDNYGRMMCMCLRRKRLELPDRAALENAMAQTVANTQKGADIENALVELAELFAAQDDALVELAEIIEEGM